MIILGIALSVITLYILPVDQLVSAVTTGERINARYAIAINHVATHPRADPATKAQVIQFLYEDRARQIALAQQLGYINYPPTYTGPAPSTVQTSSQDSSAQSQSTSSQSDAVSARLALRNSIAASFR